jgi:hypothetical protein
MEQGYMFYYLYFLDINCVLFLINKIIIVHWLMHVVILSLFSIYSLFLCSVCFDGKLFLEKVFHILQCLL